MSAAQILEALPQLSSEEREKIAVQIWKLDHTEDDVAACIENAEAGFLSLDEMEADDARRQSR